MLEITFKICNIVMIAKNKTNNIDLVQEPILNTELPLGTRLNIFIFTYLFSPSRSLKYSLSLKHLNKVSSRI